jgi:hypothetical protein
MGLAPFSRPRLETIAVAYELCRRAREAVARAKTLVEEAQTIRWVLRGAEPRVPISRHAPFVFAHASTHKPTP